MIIRYRARTLDREVMTKQLHYYGSTVESCSCGETLLESSMYRINIPCSHMVFLGASFPTLPEVELNLHTEQTTCEFEYTVINRTRETVESDTINRLEQQLVKNIRRYSHFKNKPVIEEYVNQHFNVGDVFILGKPIEYFTVSYEGIMHCKNLIKENSEKHTKKGK